MPPATLSRFHIAGLTAALLATLALAYHNVVLLVFVMAALVIIIALGVVLPKWQFFGPYVCRGDRTRRSVALTFDDGPDPLSTPAVLDLLRGEGLHATFFGVGKKVAANPELAARIVREGHLLENHAYEHSNFTNFFTTARLRAELTRTQDVIRQATGVPPRWFRPPMGLTNGHVFRAAREVGLTVIGWTARGLDTKLAEPEQIVARIARKLEPGAIILLHDGGIPAARVTETLKALLHELRALGYEVVRMDRMLT